MKTFRRPLHQRLVFVPLIATFLLHMLLVAVLARFTALPATIQWWAAACISLGIGLALTESLLKLLDRRHDKPLQHLSRLIRQHTVNGQFGQPMRTPLSGPYAELMDEVNRMMKALNRQKQNLEQDLEQLRLQDADKTIALQQEVNAHKSAQKNLQSLARELDSSNRQLQQSLQLSQTADKAKAEFLATMSHEIRTPLNAVLGVASLLERSGLNPRQHQQLGMIFESGKELLSILSDIMDYVRIEAGEIVLDEFPFNLESLLLDVMHRHREEALARGLDYQYSFASDLPRLYQGDGARVQQILNNLLDNAIKFTHEGSVVVSVSGVTLQNRAYLIRIDVQDTGIGIPDAMRDKLFKVFSQGDASLSRPYGGSGLGLAITHRLVKLMQGTLTLQSEAGFGSRFSVEIPLNLYQDVVLDESALAELTD